MKIKTIVIDGKTYAVLDDKGMPVYVHDNGTEVPFDAPATVAKISQLNGEAKTHREGKEAAEAKLKTYDGITDPAAAIKALETVKNLKDGDLVAAGKVEEIKKAAQTAAEERVSATQRAADEKIKGLEGERDTIKTQFHSEKIGNAFHRSKFITDKVAVPVDMIQAMFGHRFEIGENGALVAKTNDGKSVIQSRVKFTDPAEFDEAIEIIVNEYPMKDAIIKGSGNKGDGARAGNGSGAGGKTIARGEYDKMPMLDRQAKLSEGYTVIDG